MLDCKKLMTIAMCAGIFWLSGCSDDGDDGGAMDAATANDAALESDAPADGTCRASANCPPDEGCVGPNDVNCGVPPQEGCFGDGDCQVGDVCHVISDSCSGDGFGSMCGPACNPGDACGDNMLCNADGACRPLACDDPLVDCRPSQMCDPTTIDPTGAVYDIHRGCASISCVDDTPCPDSTVCVNGRCQDGPGVCSPPAA